MVASGLSQHGWTYINIDDTWQGQRTGKNHALQANEKFPDLKGLCADVHALGLKAGIYSTPWITSYAKFPGGASTQPAGVWSKALANAKNQALGKYSFAQADANQWADYGFDYLKYDWYPNDVVHAAEMSKALRASGRDIILVCPTPPHLNTRRTGCSGPIVGAPPATSGTLGCPGRNPGRTAFRKSRFHRIAGRRSPAPGIGMIRICWWSALSDGGPNCIGRR